MHCSGHLPDEIEKRRRFMPVILALVLTGGAFATSAMTLAIVFGLALLQMIVHFRFFLHISLGRSSRDDLQLILFSTLIVVLMVSGTIVILMNLNERMM
jgi:cytochrome o ubiquinol oxidase operon protein cyoD